MRVKDGAVLFFRPRCFLDVRVEVVVPSAPPKGKPADSVTTSETELGAAHGSIYGPEPSAHHVLATAPFTALLANPALQVSRNNRPPLWAELADQMHDQLVLLCRAIRKTNNTFGGQDAGGRANRPSGGWASGTRAPLRQRAGAV